MTINEALLDVIQTKLIPFSQNISIKATTKLDMIVIDIEDGLNINELTKIINKTALKYNIDPLNISIISIFDNEDAFSSGAKLGISFIKIVDKTEKEIQKEIEKRIENSSFKIIYDGMIEKGFKRIGFNSGLLKPFDKISVYDMIKNNDLERLVSYYSFRFASK